MEKKNNSGLLVGIIVGLVIAAIIGVALYSSKIISFNNKEENNNETSKNIIENNSDIEINVEELEKISKSDYNFLKREYTGNYSFSLYTNGKININLKEEITNVSNAKDIILFTDTTNYYLYILTKDGYIYKYNIENYDKKDYTATKVDEYSNIVKMIQYDTVKQNAGGCNFIVLIDNNNKYYKLDAGCV